MQHTCLSRALCVAVLVAGLAIRTSQAEIEIVPQGAPPAGGNAVAVPPPAGASRAAAPNGKGETSDQLVFRNGDALHGKLLSADLDRAVRWNHPDAAGVIEFGPKNVVQVRLATPTAPNPAPGPAIVRLTNDDQLRGNIVGLDTGKVVLQTWYAGQITLQRSMVASITPRAGASAALYSGPNDDDEWEKSRQERGWTFKNGALYSPGQGTVGRDLKLPDRSRIEFDLGWRNYPYLQIAFYTDNLEQVYGNCYMLQISGNSLYLQRGKNRGFNNLGGGTNVEDLQRKARAHFMILSDKSKKSIALFIDNEMVKQWVDSGDFAGSGGGVVFQAQGQGPIRVSNIVVSEWDGEFPSENVSAAKDQDIIRFINNDKVSGQLKAIANNAISFLTAFATLDIPLERAAQIDFSSDKAERARRQTNDVIAQFQDGGHVTMSLEKLDEQALTGSSENFGRLTFVRGAFQELRLHIYDESIKLTTTDEWEF